MCLITRTTSSSSTSSSSSFSSTSSTTTHRKSLPRKAKSETNTEETIVLKDGRRLPIKPNISRSSAHYYLRQLSRIDYLKIAKGLAAIQAITELNSSRRPVCDQCFRSKAQDIHLEFKDRTHTIIEVVFKGKASPPNSKSRNIWVNVYETLANGNNKYVRKVCRQKVEF